MKIIGVGISKTGTSSLAAALQMLGVSSVHNAYPHQIEQAIALVDNPAASRYRELDVMYPHSKFILTTRERHAWLESCRKHWDRVRLETAPAQVRFEYQWCRARIFGRLDFDPDNHWQCYVKHVEEVRAYFQNRPKDLLEIDVTRGDGWERLCEFLQVPAPPFPFPWKNRAPENLAVSGSH